ncbi:MAG: ferredoxin [Paracoccaceae bacterium]|nr:ferredoxin [Paracoccaceae bacterium]
MLAQIKTLAASHGLAVFGGFQVTQSDGLPKGARTLLLLGPKEPGFWPHLTGQPEWLDGAPDPVDRWSRRVIGRMACDLGRPGATVKALFPFGGPPHHPFYQWALRSGHAWDSPVRLLVHHKAGLFVSYRGALALPEAIPLPAPPPKPCNSCLEKPCLGACPASALTDAGYDLAACHTWLDDPAGQGCMKMGCAVRRACPVSVAYARMPDQSAYHMRQFHK